MSRFSAPVLPRARSRTGPASAIATRTIGACGRTSRSSSRQLPIRPRAQGSKPAQGRDRYTDRRGSSAPRSGAMVTVEVEAAGPEPHNGGRFVASEGNRTRGFARWNPRALGWHERPRISPPTICGQEPRFAVAHSTLQQVLCRVLIRQACLGPHPNTPTRYTGTTATERTLGSRYVLRPRRSRNINGYCHQAEDHQRVRHG